MPKTLLLLLSGDAALAARARQVADGVRQVRFAEVDVRAGGPGGGAPGASVVLTAADYDALVLGVALGAADAAGAASAAALAAFDPGGALADRVGAAFAADGSAAGDAACWAALRALAAHGLVLVPRADQGGAAGPAAADDAAAATLGRRVATVAGWVRHARGHEHGHAHHGHAHHGHAH